MNKIKILYIISTLEASGPVNVLFNIVRYLDYSSYEPIILTLSPEQNNSQLGKFTKLGINVISLNLSRTQIFLAINRLMKYVKELNPDIIHSHGFRADLFNGYCLHGYKKCNTVHNYPYHDYIMTYGKLKGILMSNLSMSSFKKLDCIVTCSYSISKLLKDWHGINSLVIENGVDTSLFKPVDINSKINIRKKLSMDLDKKYFTFVGNLSKRKDPLTLISAFKKACISENARLLLIGEGPLKSMCETLKDDSILIKGRADNVDEYLKASDVFVSASRAEGLPIAVLEAMSSGLPAILSNIGPHKEIFDKDKNIGDMFKVGNIDELSSHFKKYLVFDMSNKGKCARKIVENYYDARLMSNSYQKLYVTINRKNNNTC